MLELQKLGVSPEDSLQLLRALDDGAVNLLTGAGASYGVLGGDGQELKGGQDLSRELNSNFNLENVEPDSSNLQLVYGDIAAVSELRKTLAQFLRNRFSRCGVTWQGLFFDFPWKRIWTLNIDDVLQVAAARKTNIRLKSFTWNQEFAVRSLSQAELQIIYLHGRASLINVDLDNIIFSIKDYASRHENSPGWHSEFRSEFTKKPFIICGAKLRDEFDLATVLEFGNKSRERGGCPSFIVLRGFAPGEGSRFLRQGLVPIASTGENFFQALKADLESFRNLQGVTSALLREAAISVRACFKPLSSVSPRPRRVLDFYSSTETQWHHILENLDAQLDQVSHSSNWLLEEQIDPRVVLISGGHVCGKTASALRIAASLEAKGYEAWYFRNEERFDEHAVCEYLSSRPKTIFVLDDCADFSSSMSALVAQVIKRGLPLRVVATTEAWRQRGVQADLLNANVRIVELEPVPRSHFGSIFQLRNQKGRLGRCTEMKLKDAWDEFRAKFNQRSLEWLESLEGALNYRQIITELLQSVTTSTVERRLILTAAATHRFGYSLPFYLASSLSGTQDLEGLLNPPSKYSDLAYLDDKGLRLRSRSIAIDVWKLASGKERYDISLYLAKQLSPLVVPQSISRRTYPYRILRQLMDCETVEKDLREFADQWYADLLPLMGWNSRYWEQRALLAANAKQDEAAYSYAKQAVAIHPGHPYSHTTLGKICMQISIRRADNIGLERLLEGVEELKVSRELAKERNNLSEHPYVTFFSYALAAYRLYPSQVSWISRMWEEWLQAANSSRLFGFDAEGQSQLDKYRHQWRNLTVLTE
ncbi:MAG: SIR2 family protein [Acidobacteria bacterium]|nr:SIR2 family protein [Acidobacteriota bacterium]